MPWSKGPVLVLAPVGRDAEVATAILREIEVRSTICPDLESLVASLDRAHCAVVTEEALRGADRQALADWVAAQPPWSDFPFLLLGQRGAPPGAEMVEMLGNVTVLERPFHASTLVNAVRSAMRARHRQREAEAFLEERRRTAEQQSLLIRELHHRVRNMLANIHAMLGATARSSSTIEGFASAFSARIASLAKTQTLLTEDYWQSAALQQMLRVELEPYQGDGRRIELDGPEIELTADLAIPVGMALHELATNAVKYGSLSVPDGCLKVHWTIEHTGEGRSLRLEWLERGGPPVVPPRRKGFGSVMLERVLTVQCRARIEQHFEPVGLRFTMETPLPEQRLVPRYDG